MGQFSFGLPGDLAHLRACGLLDGIEYQAQIKGVDSQVVIEFKTEADWQKFKAKFETAKKISGYIFDPDRNPNNGNEVFLTPSQRGYFLGQIPLFISGTMNAQEFTQ